MPVACRSGQGARLKMGAPLVTVLSLCYNHDRFLASYFGGLLSQNYTNVNLIISNDGSTDRSLEMIQKYEPFVRDKFAKIYIDSHENIGAR